MLRHPLSRTQPEIKSPSVGSTALSYETSSFGYPVIQRGVFPSVWQAKSDLGGQSLPKSLKAGLEHHANMAMDDVRVHYNSPKPSAIGALAYAQGNQIHLGPGQGKELPHEAWHVAQQKQGRVKPKLQLKSGLQMIVDDPLEREADTMGEKIAAYRVQPHNPISVPEPKPTVQPKAATIQPRLKRSEYDDDLKDAAVEDLCQAYPHDANQIRRAHQDPHNVYVYYTFGPIIKINLLKPKAPKQKLGPMYGRIKPEAEASQVLHRFAEVAAMHPALSALDEKGTEVYGQSSMEVRNVYSRNPKHAANFKKQTGFKSAKKYTQFITKIVNAFDWDITHLKGYGQVGPRSDTHLQNLVAASAGTNTVMMFFDNLITGNRDVLVQTFAEVYTGTKIAKSITMQFAYKEAPEMPFFINTIPGLREHVTEAEAAEFKVEAARSISDVLTAVEVLCSLHNA